mgnify:FL=1
MLLLLILIILYIYTIYSIMSLVINVNYIINIFIERILKKWYLNYNDFIILRRKIMDDREIYILLTHTGSLLSKLIKRHTDRKSVV